jgi:hypothetical protein
VEEDMAYCLMGILNVNMPILYGEGPRKAFRRLQEEFMKNSFDYSLFAWTSCYAESGLLAQSPADFTDMSKLGFWSPSMLTPFQMTNLGLLIKLDFNNRHVRRSKRLIAIPLKALRTQMLSCLRMNILSWRRLLKSSMMKDGK